MTRKGFENIIRQTLRSLPKQFKDKLQNIDIVVEDGARRKNLLGLYEGIPLKDRTHGYSLVMPDKITLFKRNLEAECRALGTDLRREIRRTLEHEIAHHFGMTDEQLEAGEIY